MLGIMEERPPYVTFERRGVEKRNPGPPQGDGMPYFVDTDFAIITPQGTKDKVEKPVQDWFSYLSTMAKDGRYNPAWLEGFQARYAAWSKGLVIPENGTSVRNWPVATPSEVKRLIDLNLHTVEDLAVATEEALKALGMGARSLKKRAEDWITAQKGTGPLVAQLDAVRSTNELLQNQLAAEKARNLELARRLESIETKVNGFPPPAAPADDLASRLAAAQGSLGSDPLENL